MQTKLLSLDEAEIKFFADPNALMFGGYASIFNNLDKENDVVLPGAFADIIAAGWVPQMYFNHRNLDLPIGAWKSMEEDHRGLKVVGELTRGNHLAESVHASMKHGTITGLSIGYKVAPGGSERMGAKRMLKKFAALPEISVVTSPANMQARIDLDSIKSSLEEIDSVEHLEAHLREVVGFSKQAALAWISRARSVLSGSESREQKAEAVPVQLAEPLTKLVRFTFPEFGVKHERSIADPLADHRAREKAG
jgi:HK97 family phage prohead protease